MCKIRESDKQMSKDELTVALVKELLSYNPETGVFTWRVNRGGTARVGATAGTIGKKGYRYIGVKNKCYLAHRLAWLYIYGCLPEKHIDHINREKSDNRIDNLREVSNSQNHWNLNTNSANTSGYTGVSWNKRAKKWHSYIHAQGKRKHLGLFNTPEEAHAAYVEAKAEHHKIGGQNENTAKG